MAAESGIDGHQQHHVDLVNDVLQPVEWRGRIEDQSGLAALLPNQAKRSVRMPARLGVERDVAGAGLCEVRNNAIDWLNHEVNIDRRFDAVVPQGVTNQRSNRQVRHEMIIHHVEMHDVGASIQYGVDVIAQAGEICREY